MSASQVHHWVRSAGRIRQARLSRWRTTADRVKVCAEELATLSDDELRASSRELRWRAKTGIPLSQLLVEAFALVHEATRRATGMEFYPVQLMGGMALFEGHIAEMRTGEGKTLTAVLPVYLRALPGRGCHVVTVNDYLAGRDAEEMGVIYNLLGLSVGCIDSDMEDDDRRAAYAKDITYGTAKEMGFDFLRDRLRLESGSSSQRPRRAGGVATSSGEAQVQRGHYFALVDEADSILIDDARTPLIIGLTVPNDAGTINLLRWSRMVAERLEVGTHFVYEPDQRNAGLTDRGCRRVLLLKKPSLLNSVDSEQIYEHIENALTAQYGFLRGRDYVVVDEEVVIVDESTGRIMEGRKWQDGLHQAVEAKERAPITAATGQAAKITVQSFYREYIHLAGMTGTAVQAAKELKRTYDLKVTPIPTHRPEIRQPYQTKIFATADAKRNAIVENIQQLYQTGRAVLIGTPSVEASEALSELMNEHEISHTILNAVKHAEEAEIVRLAGQPGAVTIATNMAGRGTDIKLHKDVLAAGGLHVLATEFHSSSRIDRQLIGRCSRQGDPGTYQFWLSLEDELLRMYTPTALKRIKRGARPNANGELPQRWVGVFHRAQRRLEKMHLKQRKDLLKQKQKQLEAYDRMGIDPYLELIE
ncbi:MAG: translocase [Planctomycetaceae bacterium]|nr:translocase [Planctomycetaceae bacterium]